MGNKTNIAVLPHNDCCGCRACGDICPANCISYVKDNEGFLFPQIDEDVCFHCGKCASVCPELNIFVNQPAQDVYAAYASSSVVRQEGSSGGLFGVIARQVISKGGKVWGAAFDENLKLHHQAAACESELHPLFRSKYLQSDLSGCYRQIAIDLNAGILTLFCGTPCQCNALKNYIGKDSENLILIDLICHGVPSQDLFDKSVDWLERQKQGKIKNFIFRSKYAGALHPQAFSYVLEAKGKSAQINGLHYQNPFYFGFQKYITLRLSCYKCKWAQTQRPGDITLGDFWGIERLNPNLNPKSGISEVIVNTARGKQLINEIYNERLIVAETFKMSEITDSNGTLHNPTPLKPERAELFENLASLSFDEVVKRHLVSRRRWIFDIYYGMPAVLRHIVRRVMDKHMKYE